MEYLGEFNLLEWREAEGYFIQIPTGLKEKGTDGTTVLEIIERTLVAPEIKQLNDMESVSTCFPLKKKTAKEVMKGIIDDTIGQGIDFVADSLIEVVTGWEMGTDAKSSLFNDVVSLILDEEERQYIAAIGKYEKDQLFFESLLPTSTVVQSYFVTEYEADLFVAVVAIKTFQKTQDFQLEELEKQFLKQFDSQGLNTKEEELSFIYKGKAFPLRRLNSQLSFNVFTMDLEDFLKND